MRIFLYLSLSLLPLSCATTANIQPTPTAAPVASYAAPPLFDFKQIGRTTFPKTTTSPEAQRYFEQGISLLHNFWYYEALRSFRHAARIDSTCAMAWWGIYQTPRGSRALKRQALRRARLYTPQTSDRERGYIHAIAARDSLGRRAYIEKMQALIEHYPDDIEAKVFLIRYLMRGYNPDKKRAGAVDPLELISPLLASHPDHVGVHHYYIHLIEPGSQPERALESAHKIAAMAPASGHIVHMPGHIYYLTGDYEKARISFIESFEADSTYMADYGIAPFNNWNYVHNLSYLVANSAEDGRYRDGLAWAEYLQRVPLNSSRNIIFYQGRLAKARLQIRYEFWDKAVESLASLVANDTLKTSFARSYARGLQLYSSGMGAVEVGDSTAAAADLKKIKDMTWTYAFGGGHRGDSYYARRRVNYFDVLAFDLQAHLLSLRGDAEGAIDRIEDARRDAEKSPYEEPPEFTRPIAESQGHILLRLGDWQGARDAFLQAQKKSPHSGHILWALAQAYEMGGQKRLMRQTYQDMLIAWRFADENLPQLQEARQKLQAIGQ